MDRRLAEKGLVGPRKHWWDQGGGSGGSAERWGVVVHQGGAFHLGARKGVIVKVSRSMLGSRKNTAMGMR